MSSQEQQDTHAPSACFLGKDSQELSLIFDALYGHTSLTCSKDACATLVPTKGIIEIFLLCTLQGRRRMLGYRRLFAEGEGEGEGEGGSIKTYGCFPGQQFP